MFKLTELTYGTIDFEKQDEKLQDAMQGFHVPGSVTYSSRQPFAHIFFQHFERGQFSFWKSIYDAKENITLHAWRNKPWLGFRVLLKKHIRHVMTERRLK